MMKIWTTDRTREVLALADELEAITNVGGSTLHFQTVHDLRRLAHSFGTLPACDAQQFLEDGTLVVVCTRDDYHGPGSMHRAVVGPGADVVIEWPVRAS